ncbi:hypothetical protein P8452_10006 [Trifolium repens]|nr:hypothetical protein P8452_10004 [Trifolium repens]WJX20452.1 hypothetical protein P8452_10006 [Trifolium repens]
MYSLSLFVSLYIQYYLLFVHSSSFYFHSLSLYFSSALFTTTNNANLIFSNMLDVRETITKKKLSLNKGILYKMQQDKKRWNFS